MIYTDFSLEEGYALGNELKEVLFSFFEVMTGAESKHEEGRRIYMNRAVNASVIVREDEPFEKALKRFKRQCQDRGVIGRVKRSLRYEKPSEERQRKAREARLRALWRVGRRKRKQLAAAKARERRQTRGPLSVWDVVGD